jgi:hypothetical protein
LLLIATFGVGGALFAERLGAQEADRARDVDPPAAELERIRDATRAFHDVTAAHVAGYPTTVPGCLENPPHGGMGHHYMHPGLMDDELDLERPEILVYAPTGEGDTAEGHLKLVGVEYVVPFSAWPRDADEVPRILGHDLKPSDGLQIWYLHVWVWEENRNGLFADWNPAVRCAA